MAERQKVFGIGFHKTGTTSLGHALQVLGYDVCPGFGYEANDIEGTIVARALERAQSFDAFEDNPWPLLFEDLDRAFPGSKFIATWRAPEAWFASVERHFGRDVTQMRKWIYGPENGAPLGKHDIYVSRYKAHYDAIERHFAERPGDFIKVDISTSLNWETLCAFLDKPVPMQPFPRSNTGASTGTALRKRAADSYLGRQLRRGRRFLRKNWT